MRSLYRKVDLFGLGIASAGGEGHLAAGDASGRRVAPFLRLGFGFGVLEGGGWLRFWGVDLPEPVAFEGLFDVVKNEGVDGD